MAPLGQNRAFVTVKLNLRKELENGERLAKNINEAIGRSGDQAIENQFIS
jgi:hypothetical protein